MKHFLAETAFMFSQMKAWICFIKKWTLQWRDYVLTNESIHVIKIETFCQIQRLYYVLMNLIITVAQIPDTGLTWTNSN